MNRARIEIEEIHENWYLFFYNENNELFELFGPFNKSRLDEIMNGFKRMMAEAEIKES